MLDEREWDNMFLQEKVKEINEKLNALKDISHVAGMDFWGSIRQLLRKRFHVDADGGAEDIRAEDSEML